MHGGSLRSGGGGQRWRRPGRNYSACPAYSSRQLGPGTRVRPREHRPRAWYLRPGSNRLASPRMPRIVPRVKPRGARRSSASYSAFAAFRRTGGSAIKTRFGGGCFATGARASWTVPPEITMYNVLVPLCARRQCLRVATYAIRGSKAACLAVELSNRALPKVLPCWSCLRSENSHQNLQALTLAWELPNKKQQGALLTREMQKWFQGRLCLARSTTLPKRPRQADPRAESEVR